MIYHNRVRFCGVAVVALLFGVVGCAAGGDDDGGSSETPNSGFGNSPSTGGSSGATGGSTGSGGGGYSPATGGGTSATGGSASATGGAPSTGGSSSSVSLTPVPSTFVTEGFGENGPWHGYAYTFTSTKAPGTVSPSSYTGAGANLCASGTMPGSYDAVGGLGWNIAQAKATDATSPPKLAWDSTGTTGMTVSLNNQGSGPLRVQVTADEDGKDVQYCVAAPAGGSGDLAWSDFKTNCWEGGTPQTPLTAGAKIKEIQVLQPGTLSPSSFAFCVVTLAVKS